MKVELTEKEIKQAVKEYCEKSGVVVTDVYRDVYLSRIKNEAGVDTYFCATVYVGREKKDIEPLIP